LVFNLISNSNKWLKNRLLICHWNHFNLSFLVYKNMLFFTTMLTLLQPSSASQCQKSISSIPGSRLVNHVIQQEISQNGAQCLLSCMKKKKCYSINYKTTDKLCEINGANSVFSQQSLMRDPYHHFFYSENPEKIGNKQVWDFRLKWLMAEVNN